MPIKAGPAHCRTWVFRAKVPVPRCSYYAAFRRTVPFDQILRLNLERKVQVPDLYVGVVTAAETSWARAAARTRGLGSTVIHNLDEQVACTEAFERAVAAHGWVLCRNEGTIDEATRQVVGEIQGVLARMRAVPAT